MAITEGSVFGQYRIIGLIGQGGMASVYRAYQPNLRREVAIKVLGAHLADNPAFQARFRREAEVLARLEHPHILPIFDYGEQDGQAYIVYRYVSGGTVWDLLTAVLPLDDVVRLLLPVADALDYAHGQGVVHRDIKPANILLTAAQVPVVADFGLARLLPTGSESPTQDGSIWLTQVGLGLGTPAYMAPEQVLGLPVDGRADQYALGIVAYQMLTNSLPFSAPTPSAVAFQRLHDAIPPPSSRNSALPPHVDRTLLQALSREPDGRFPNCRAFLTALAAPRSHGDQHADPAGPLEETRFYTALPAATTERRAEPAGRGDSGADVYDRPSSRGGDPAAGETTSAGEPSSEAPVPLSRRTPSPVDSAPASAPEMRQGATAPRPTRRRIRWALTAVIGLALLGATITAATLAVRRTACDSCTATPTVTGAAQNPGGGGGARPDLSVTPTSPAAGFEPFPSPAAARATTVVSSPAPPASPSSTATPRGPGTQQQQLEAAVLQQGDLPAGFVLVADDRTDPAPLGETAFYRVLFRAQAGSGQVGIALYGFATDGAAATGFLAQQITFPALSGSNYTATRQSQAFPLDPGQGPPDGSVSYRVVGPLLPGADGGWVITWRRGHIVGFMALMDRPAPAAIDALLTLAQRQDARLIRLLP